MVTSSTKYQIINQPGNEKRDARIQKELANFSLKINAIKGRSKQILASLHNFVDKKKILSITNRIANQTNHA